MVAGMNMGCECVRKGCLRESPVMRWTMPAEGDEFRNAREGLYRMQTNAVEKPSMMKNIGIMNARRCTLLSPFLFRLSWEVGIAIAAIIEDKRKRAKTMTSVRRILAMSLYLRKYLRRVMSAAR
jgi:hypothetical protein